MDNEGTEKRFTRTVQGSSSDYRINDEVYFCLFIVYLNMILNINIFFCSLYQIKSILHS